MDFRVESDNVIDQRFRVCKDRLHKPTGDHEQKANCKRVALFCWMHRFRPRCGPIYMSCISGSFSIEDIILAGSKMEETAKLYSDLCNPMGENGKVGLAWLMVLSPTYSSSCLGPLLGHGQRREHNENDGHSQTERWGRQDHV